MPISKRNLKIYKIATEPFAPTLAEIGDRFGISRQRVSAIVKQVQAALGTDAKQLPEKPAQYPIRGKQFLCTVNQTHAINTATGNTYADRIRSIIDFYGTHYSQETVWPDEDQLVNAKGVCYISQAQAAIIELAPGKTYAQKIRHIIDYYISKNKQS